MNPRWTLPIAGVAAVVALLVGYLIGDAGTADLESDLERSQARARDLEEDLAAANSELSGVRSDMADLEAQIARLQAELEEAKKAPPPKPEPQSNAQPSGGSSPAATDPDVIRTFTGTGIQRPPPFNPPGAWTLRWKANGAVFQVYGYQGGSNIPEVLANDTCGGGCTGGSYVPTGGEWRLEVNAIGSWTLTVVRA